jgi:signal transduction histidine kinase
MAVEIPLLPAGRGGLQRLVFWVFLLLLVASAAVVLMLSLRPLRRRMGRLERVVGDLASGNLSARVPTASPGDLVDSLGGSFNRMADRIQALVASHQELLGMVAHEIRTPLARMRFAMELLKDSCDPGDTRITRMERDLESLDSMLAELLAFNRLSRAEVPVRTPVELADLAAEALALESWRDRGVESAVEGSAVVGGDRAMLLRALSNLVRNALAFASSRIRIVIAGSGGEVAVTVEDDGPGFDPSVAGRLGKAFVKHVDSPGSGLGLAMVERIAALHGGRVEYGRAHGGGALVRLVLPAAD